MLWNPQRRISFVTRQRKKARGERRAGAFSRLIHFGRASDAIRRNNWQRKSRSAFNPVLINERMRGAERAWASGSAAVATQHRKTQITRKGPNCFSPQWCLRDKYENYIHFTYLARPFSWKYTTAWIKFVMRERAKTLNFGSAPDDFEHACDWCGN